VIPARKTFAVIGENERKARFSYRHRHGDVSRAAMSYGVCNSFADKLLHIMFQLRRDRQIARALKKLAPGIPLVLHPNEE
jgi:hypothetical protein